MKQFHIVFIVFVICISSINGLGTCPTGIGSIQDCSSKLCPSGLICYRKDNARICCGALDRFCPTKMHAFNTVEKGYDSYVWWPAPLEEKDEWYNVQLASDIVACPFPNSFAYSLYNELKVLPVDFDANKPGTSTPKACFKNADCKTDNDEFCGATYHPTYPQTLDQSGKDGSSLKFCYKFQNFGSSNVKPVIIAAKTELTGCDNISDCFPFKGTETFCQRTEKLVRFAGNKETFKKEGFCAFHPKSGALWWYLLAGSIVCTVICLVLSMTFYILHRKSVVKATEMPTKTETTKNSVPLYKPNDKRKTASPSTIL